MSALTKRSAIFPDWHFNRWQAVDDRVRGGSSQSHLDSIAIPASSAVTRGEKPTGARFWGTLDTKTLGGAGFASQRYIFGPDPLYLPRVQYEGITLRLLPDHQTKSHKDTPRNYTLVLKTSPHSQEPPKPKLPPSPEPASLSYEHDFSLSSAASDSPEIVKLSFQDFTTVYRGREVDPSDPRYKPFDSSRIYELSLMCRSGFGKQEGEFGVVVVSVEAWGRGEGKERDGCWRSVRGWVGSWLGGERGVKL